MAHQSYLEDILNVNGNSSNPLPNTKKLYSLLKHAKQDNFGISDLKKNGKRFSDDQDKANILNEQFQSVFTEKNLYHWDHYAGRHWRGLGTSWAARGLLVAVTGRCPP